MIDVPPNRRNAAINRSLLNWIAYGDAEADPDEQREAAEELEEYDDEEAERRGEREREE